MISGELFPYAPKIRGAGYDIPRYPYCKPKKLSEGRIPNEYSQSSFNIGDKGNDYSTI